MCRPGEPHSRSSGRCRPKCSKCLCHLHHPGTGASVRPTHRDHPASQRWANWGMFCFPALGRYLFIKCGICSQTSSTEPHSPLVILERGRLSFNQYEQQIRARRDFVRCTRKDSEPERKVGGEPHLLWCFFVYFQCLLFPDMLLFWEPCRWSLWGSDTTKTSWAARYWCSTSVQTCCVNLWSCTKPPESCCSSWIGVAVWAAPTSAE